MSVICDDCNHGRCVDYKFKVGLLAAGIAGNSTDCAMGNDWGRRVGQLAPLCLGDF